MGKQEKKAPVIKTFLDWVLHEGTKKESRFRDAHDLCLLEGSSGFIYDEFYELLEKSRFVSRVIDIHTREKHGERNAFVSATVQMNQSQSILSPNGENSSMILSGKHS